MFVKTSEFKSNRAYKKKQGRKKMSRDGIPNMAYLQFVPARVTNVIRGSANYQYQGQGSVGAITVELLVTSADGSSSDFKEAEVQSQTLYKPLLRTLHDVPVKGDEVLVVNLGPYQKYYLGPINTKNSPTRSY